MPTKQEIEQLNHIESAVFKRLVEHLQKRSDVQNIELMILADFCRNCLAKWYKEAAQKEGVAVDYEQARELVYGMPYHRWKEIYQKPMTKEQEKAFAKRGEHNDRN